MFWSKKNEEKSEEKRMTAMEVHNEAKHNKKLIFNKLLTKTHKTIEDYAKIGLMSHILTCYDEGERLLMKKHFESFDFEVVINGYYITIKWDNPSIKF